VAVGNPFGLGGTVTAGIISARGRDIESGPFDDFLQIDAPINRGNSGGPLFDAEGRVIGINTAIYSPSGGNVGIGFAIPSTMAKDIIAQLRTEGRVTRGWLGVQIQPVTKVVAESLGLEEQRGALVASVVPDGPADRAGVEAGDVIVRMNGKKLDGFKDLPRLVAKARAGSDSTLEVRRNGKTRKLQVEIGRMPVEEVEVALVGGDGVPDSARLGIHLAELTSEARERHGISKQSVGVLVVGVERGSPASKAGIRVGSVIQMVGQESVESPAEVVAKVKEAADQRRSAVLLLLEHHGERRFVAVEFAAA
jgi:serine protease Do